jgi:hypothetical protein
MESSKFDALTRSCETNTRRSVLRLLAGTSVGAMVLGRFGIDDAAAGCVKPGNKCKSKNGKKLKCCGGAKCKGGKCKCTNGGPACGKACCAPGQICEDAASSTCVNGSLIPGDQCDPDKPLACQSGKCECFTLGDLTNCTCRQEGCFGQGVECGNTSQCCQGFCSEFEDPPVCVTLNK